jgi:FkbM family methyltransferase
MNPRFKYSLKRLLRALGIRRTAVHRSTMSAYIKRVRAMGFIPSSVIDVGVADGTFALYDGFRGARFLLIEPMKEFEPALKSICRHINGKYELIAASNSTGNSEIFYSEYLHGASTRLKMNNKREVRTQTIDALVEKHKMKGPFVIKVDVQGSEIDVMSGALKTLEETEIVILEANLFDISIDANLIPEIVVMEKLGFVPHDFFDGLPRPVDGALGSIDIAFVKKEGRFRANKVWA